jgi:solute:Na+ symporter, SSS family
MHWIDLSIVGASIVLVLVVGAYFSKRAGSDIASFFVSDRSLTWYIAGTSMIATSFASDTPLWVTSLVRQHGIQAVWQFWAPVIGSALAVALFGRLWRRVGVLTDLQLIELRYSGKSASVLHAFSATMFAVILAPLIIGWVVKSMEVISRTTLGIPEEYRVLTTFIVLGVSVIICALSGLYGVVYTDFVQFVVGALGMLVLAAIAVHKVGGLETLVDTLAINSDWSGRSLTIAPEIGSSTSSMSVWNAIGYFGLLWWIVAQSGGYQAQRLLASRDVREASLAQLLYTVVYYSLMAWPWIIVALCSLILIPHVDQENLDTVFPTMLVNVLPIGMRGLAVAAMVAAFGSTVSTIFNWASSYLVIDLYKRYMHTNATDAHYVSIARLTTIGIALAGGLVSLTADSIQQLLEVYYTVALAVNLLAIIRWFWWRQNATGELVGILTAWSVACLLLFTKTFDEPFRSMFSLGTNTSFSSDYEFLGGRILFVTLVAMFCGVSMSLLTPATDMRSLREFVRLVRPFQIGWKSVIATLDETYSQGESPIAVLWQWLLVTSCSLSLLFGIGQLLLGSAPIGMLLLSAFAVTLVLSIVEINRQSRCDTFRENESRRGASHAPEAGN